MTPHSSPFIVLPSCGKHHLIVANGSHAPVVKCGKWQHSTTTFPSLNQTGSKPPSKIWHQHSHLGNPLFNLLKPLFLSLSSTFIVMFEFAKQRCAIFSPSTDKNTEPFDRSYYDVWGLVSASNMSRTKWFVSFIGYCIVLMLLGYFYERYI